MNPLKLQILLGAVDKITAPLRAASGQSRLTAKDLLATKQRIKELETQSGQIDGYRTLGNQIGATRAQLSQAQRDAQQMAQQFAKVEQPTKAMTRAMEQAKQKVRDLSQQEREMVARHGSLKRAMTETGINTKQLGQHQRQLKTDLAAANTQLDQQRAKLGQVAAQQKRLSQIKASYDKTMSMRGTIAGYGAAGMATGAAGLYKINSMASVGLDFDAQMSKVQALTRLQKGSDELAMLRRQARDLGASTSFTAMDAAGGQGFLAMAGFTPKAIKDAMPGILDMAKAGGMEIARSADIASNILTGFKLPAAEMNRVGDALVATFTRSNTSLDMLGETMRYAAPVAAELGVSLETSAAMAGKLGDAGIQGSMAGTAQRAIMGRLAAPPKAAADALAELGIKTKDATGKLREMPDLLTELHQKTAKLGNATRSGFFKAIAGEEAFAALAVLVNQAGSGDLQKLIAEIKQAKGESAEVAKVMADNARGDIDGLTSAWQDLNIEMMTSQNGPLRGLIQQITAMTRGIGEWMRANPELTATITKVAAITAVAAAAGGSLLLIVAGLLGPLAALKMGFGMVVTMGGPLLTFIKLMTMGMLKFGLAMLTNPIGWFIMGIAAIAAGAYLLYKNWNGVTQWFRELWDKCKAPLLAYWDLLKEIFSWTPIGMLTMHWSEIWAFFDTLPADAANKGRAIIDGLIGGIAAKWESLKAKIKALTDLLPDWMKGGGSVTANINPSGYLTGNYNQPALASGYDYGTTRRIREQVQPVASSHIADASRTVREQVINVNGNGTGRDGPRIVQTAKPVAARGASSTTEINAPIHIVQQPGQSGADVAQEVSRELDKRERQAAARKRATLGDRN
ncbi:phage tail tape measure protein [Aeromonas salmonicida]|uniref:phage tail tape measure protein n=1 Tax=Aeromonas salmonicida TaxID=645 RepID=UPI003CE896DB